MGVQALQGHSKVCSILLEHTQAHRQLKAKDRTGCTPAELAAEKATRGDAVYKSKYRFLVALLRPMPTSNSTDRGARARGRCGCGDAACGSVRCLGAAAGHVYASAGWVGAFWIAARRGRWATQTLDDPG